MLPNDAISRIRRYARPGERLYAPVVWYDDCEWSGNSGQSNCWCAFLTPIFAFLTALEMAGATAGTASWPFR